FFFSSLLPHPSSTLFPYTTLFRSMFGMIKSQFGGLDIFVSNARATLATGFYAEPMDIPLQAWQATFDTQATEFLVAVRAAVPMIDRKSTRLNSSHDQISYAVFCLK